MAARQGAQAAEFQKILDHGGMVWNCWTRELAQLGVAHANASQARTSQRADADAAGFRAVAADKAFLAVWRDADPDIPINKQAKPSTPKLQEKGGNRRKTQGDSLSPLSKLLLLSTCYLAAIQDAAGKGAVNW